jgi:hypothetical protein
MSHADLISITYGSTFKVLVEKHSKEVYVLAQCGTTQPTLEQVNAVKAVPTNYTVKHFEVPLQAAMSSSTIHNTFFEVLGVEDRIKYASAYSVAPCWQKLLGCGGNYISSKVSDQLKDVNAFFTDCGSGGCENVNKMPKAIHISASHDTSPLRNAEHVKFIAAFFNKEGAANSKFSTLLNTYTSSALTMSPKMTVAWITAHPKTSWGFARLELSAAKYKLKYVSDVGATNVDGQAAMQAARKMTVTTKDSGSTYTLKLDDVGGDLSKASEAFFAALGDVDVVIDETYKWGHPDTYTLDTFLSNYGLSGASQLKFLKNKRVLRFDGDFALPSYGTAWFESRLAEPQLALDGLAKGISGQKRGKYFRNIALGETATSMTKDMCTETLPGCQDGAYPDIIPMMAYTCTTASSGSACATCVAPASRTTDNHCATCNSGHGVSGTACKATTTSVGTTTTMSAGTTATTAGLDTSKLEGTASFNVPSGDVDLIVNNQTRKDAMKEGFAVAIKVAVSKFTKFEVTKHTRRLGVEQEAPVRQLTGHNINVAYTIDLTGLANKAKIAADAKILTTATLQQKVQEKLSAVGYKGAIVSKSFKAAHPAMSVEVTSASISANMWMAAPAVLFLYFA